MKLILPVIIVFYAFTVLSFSSEVEVGSPVFEKRGMEVVPVIEGFTLDGTGESYVLPYKIFRFSSEVKRVEIIEQLEIDLKHPLAKGMPLFKVSTMDRVQPVSSIDNSVPTIGKFIFPENPSFRRGLKEHQVKFYPVIPVSDTKVIFIKKAKFHFETGTAPVPMQVDRKRSLLILTSDMFMGRSKELSNFIKAKRAQGFRVDVATEKDYQADALRGYKRAEAIRQWLRTVYKDYHFLLIIADPSPAGGDVPMIVTRPNRGEVELAYEEAATDVFYGEISEDIDKNRNGVPGERFDEIRLAFELVVGRIPFYEGRYEDADKILARTVRYIYEPSSLSAYRREILFPTSIAYYEGQDGNPFIPKMDGAYVARYIENNLLPDYFTTKVLVETEGEAPSEYADIEEPLTYDSMLDNWNDSYGIVYWMGHGMPTYTVKTIWQGDRRNLGYPSSWDMKSETFVDSNMTMKFKENTTPFVFQGSCLNGQVENSRNLGFSTLLNSAVGVVTSTQVAYATIWKDYDLSSQDLFTYGTVFVDALLNNRYPAEVIQEKKETWSNGSVLLTMKYALNYLGDPSLHMDVVHCSADQDCDDGLFCTGKAFCVEGFCQRDFSTVPCISEEGNVCRETLCDETAKTCVSQNSEDGIYCGEPANLCFDGKRCLAGECSDWGEKDCSSKDSDCSIGFCNPENGECEIEEISEGKECDDGLFCTVETMCVSGVCSGKEIDMPDPDPCNQVVCDNNTEDFSQRIDNGQNWNKCVRADGREGHCYYGICEVSDNDGKNSKGCTVTVL